MSTPSDTPKTRRERSRGRPGVGLSECEDLCRAVASKKLDGLSAAEIASGLGYQNIKTNTFSAALSASIQLGLIDRTSGRHALTTLAKSILDPKEPGALPGLRMIALRHSPLYSELIDRYAGKRLPEIEILADLLRRHHGISAVAKLSAARAFVDSIRLAGAIGEDRILLADLDPIEKPPATSPPPLVPGRKRGETRLDLRLWGEDDGKVVRVRAPASMSEESFERVVLALRLLVRSKTRDA